MPYPTYQQTVAAFVETHDLKTSVEARLLDLVSETGEVAKEVLKGSVYGREPFSPGPAWAEELADVFFALICVANSTGVNLEKELEATLAKYKRRLSGTGEAGSGR